MTQAMLLAAGFSTRLYPLTESIPKPLLPFLGHKLLDYTLAYLSASGVRDVCTNVHHGKEAYLQEIKKNSHGAHIRTYLEESILGTGGGIKNMRDFITKDHFMVVNCDFMTDIDLIQAFEHHQKSGAMVTLVIHDHPHKSNYGELGVGENSEILFFPNKAMPPETTTKTGMFTGIHFLRKDIFDHLPAADSFCIVKDVYKPLHAKGFKINAFYTKNNTWLDVGEKPCFAETQFELLKKPFEWMRPLLHSEPFPPHVKVQGTHLLGKNVTLGQNIELRGNVIIGEGATIADGVTLENTIVFPGTSIDSNAQLKNSIATPTDTLCVS